MVMVVLHALGKYLVTGKAFHFAVRDEIKLGGRWQHIFQITPVGPGARRGMRFSILLRRLHRLVLLGCDLVGVY